jgi:hypothetical protein
MLELDGEDLRPQPLLERKRYLEKVLGPKGGTSRSTSTTLPATLPTSSSTPADPVSTGARRRGPTGRSKIWPKVKNRTHPELGRIMDSF